MLQLLDLIPKWLLAAIIATLAATSCKLKWENGQLTIEIEKGKTYVASLETSIARANETSAAQLAQNERRAREAEQAREARLKAAMADAARARDELDGLRDAVSRYTAARLTASPASLAPSLETVDPIPDLFLQCTARYVDLAAKADGHVADVQALTEAWPK